MNVYQYIVRINNHASSALQSIASSAGVANTRIQNVISSMRNMNQQSNAVTGSLGKLKTMLAGAFAFASIMSFTNKVIEARQEYEKFDAVLTNTFQSKTIGQGAMALLTEFAQKTPYQLNELTGGFIKLVNRGVYPTYEELTKLGDLASSQGKSFDQLVEGILDAQSGEFERMKEFGIKASKEGDKVKLSFKGITKEVKNNETAIRDAILEFGGMKGVAGSMEVVAETLGGKISNLEDQFWGFLVAVGSFGGGVFGEVLGAMADGLEFLQQYLPQIAHWFDVVWQNLQPVALALWDLIKAIIGVKGSGDALETFGNVMVGVLLVINWFKEGMLWLISIIKPFAPLIRDAAIAWGIFNLAMAMTPVGWIVVGIVTLITLIGILIKYSDGWSESWMNIKIIFGAVWDYLKGSLTIGVETFKYGFNLIYLYAKDAAQNIVGVFTKVGDAIKLAMQGDFSAAFSKVTEKVRTEAEGEIAKLNTGFSKKLLDFGKQTENNTKAIKEASKGVGITFDSDGISKDFKKLKDSFKGLEGEKQGNKNDYLNAIPGLKGTMKPKDDDKDKDKKKKKAGDGITGGGSRLTNITININKLQDQTVINVSKTEEGLSGLGDKVQEILLRAVNSANQMQTN
ncbi:hypothetical protein LJF28_04825 [Chryseobacterium indologenes]|uniref:hypothetical protein n=1 Tax=Chryseobacterium indologenes TaxID=253 RepID=UPI001D0D15B2|nr:hypothetical protein [Chryseobacterium indologenes]UDQ54993.1 hypothetical protein LJF28_04825 [Chryseobacterium indologenes]